MSRCKLMSVVLVFIFVIASAFIDARFVFAELEPNENSVVKVTEANIYSKTKYFYDQNPFGIIGGFHLVGFNSVTTHSHTNGNILTNTLIYRDNFGTKGLEEISYIKNLEMESSALTYGGYGREGSEDSVLVVGKNIKIGNCDNGNAWTLAGKDGNEYKVNHPPVNKNGNSANQLWQDSDECEFIDIDLEKEKAVVINQRLRNYANLNTESHLDDINNQYIKINDSAGVNIYNLNPNSESIKNAYKINGCGFEHNSNASLVINVDLKDYVNQVGEKIFSIPESRIQYLDGDYAPTGEVTQWQDGNIVWNFYDSSQTDGCYTGKIVNSGAVTGIILAPKATVELNQNLNGSVIANDIVVNAESHRTDFTGTDLYPDSEEEGEEVTSIKIEKKWGGQKLSSAKINLLANNEIKETVELNENNNWRYEFKNLPLKDDSNNKIIYSIIELGAPGYLTQIEKKSDSYFVITNTEQINISVKKEWYGNKLDSAVVHLYANGTEIDQVELNQENNWKHDFTSLNKYKDNQEIVYSITEDIVPNYSSKIIREDNKFTVRNISTEKTNVLVRKEFVDNKLDEVTINLWADNEKLKSIKLNAENNWQYEFKDLNKYDETDGHKIIYDIDEDKIPGYIFSKTGNPEQGFIITNTEIDEKEDDSSNKSDKSNENENPPSFSFTTIENDLEDGVVIWHDNTEKNNYVRPPVSDFDISGPQINDEATKTIDVVAPDDIENSIYQSEEIENNPKELPKTGDGLNPNFYTIVTAISGIALFLIGLILNFKKKHD